MKPLLVLALAAVAAVAQVRPVFEIADVHATPKGTPRTQGTPVMRGARYEIRGATMLDLVRTAYNIEEDLVVGGPAWLESDRFDVLAKAASSSSSENLRAMLQSLLADRFGLVVHPDTRPVSAYVLSQGKAKHKLTTSQESGPGACDRLPPQPVPTNAFNCHGITMETFAARLRMMAGAYFDNRIVDATGLKGAWDFAIHWNPRGAASGDGITIFEAIERQLGLKLEPGKAPMPVIVVDRVNRTPTPNPPGVTTSLPPPPPSEFEVAVIKPSPDGRIGGRGFLPGGQLDFRGISLKNLIGIAYDLRPAEEIAGAPKWLTNEGPKFDLTAKTSSRVVDSGNPENFVSVDLAGIRGMLRTLLAERFHLKTHYEERPVTAYTLVAVKPKLKPADPANRSTCKTTPAPFTRNPAGPSLPMFQAVCTNVTMAEFADRLPEIARVYLHYPVPDATGLEGSFDISFAFTPVPPGDMPSGGGRGGDRGGKQVASRPAEPPPSGELAASDPIAGISLFDALKQLGLKLEMQKRPVQVLVIDRLEPTPTEN